MAFADDRADAVATLDALASITRADVVADTQNAPPGWIFWRADRAFVCVPILRPDAPPEVVARYWARVRAGLTGSCPLCGEVANITGPSNPDRMAYWALPITVKITHDPDCPALFSTDEAHLFDPRAFA